MAKTELPVLYDCRTCPAYCCSYDLIVVTRRDITRLAKHHGVSYALAEERFTKMEKGYGRVLRHKHDTVFKSTCQFLHPTERRCTIYEDRPAACRGFPEAPRCHYYDFLKKERDRQDDETYIPLVHH